MKNILFLFATAFFIACSSGTKNEIAPDKETTPESKNVESSSSSSKSDRWATGGYQITIGDNALSANAFIVSNTDINYFYNGDKSQVTVRIRDKETGDNVLLTLYGDEALVEQPEGNYTQFLLGGNKKGNRVNLQIMVKEARNFLEGSYSIKDGTLEVQKFDDGEIEVNFEGVGGKPMDVATGKNLIPINGKIQMATSNVVVRGTKQLN